MDSNDSNSLIPNTKIEMKSKPKVRKISPEEFEKNRIIKAWLKDLERAKYRVQQLEKSCNRLGLLCHGTGGYCNKCGNSLYWWV